MSRAVSIATDRGLVASVAMGCTLVGLQLTFGLPWWLWLAWAAVTVWAVVEAVRE